MSDENNILANGGFEATTADEATNSVDHGTWYTADAIEGWSATEGSIEIQSRSFGPTDATGILSSGAVLELDSHDYRSNCWFGRRDNADSTVAQSFTLDTDGTFELGFSYAARATTKTSDFSVSILDTSGAVVFFQEFSGHEGNLEVAWQRFTQDLELSAGDYTLAFSSAEYADRDTIGALIDNVSFIDTGPKAQDDAYTLDLGVSEILNVEATVGTDTRDVTVLDEDFSGERHLTRLETIADSDLVGKNGAAFSNSRADGVLLFNTVDVSMLDTGTLSFTIETDGKNRSGFEAADSRYGDYVRVEISVDGGEFILLDMFEVRQQDLGLRGDQQTFVGSLTGQTFTSQSSALSYALPVGATSVQLRFITELSSSDEIIKFDDVLIQGEESFETGYATGLLSNDTDGNGEALEIISAEGTGLFSYADEDVTVLDENFDDAGRHLDDLDTVEESNLRGRNGVAQATSRGDGELEFAEVDIAGLGGETFSFSLNADALGCNRFESYGWARDFVKVEARFDDGSYQTIDTFDVEWRSGQQIFVGRNSGQEVAVSDGFVNLSYDLSALAGDAATAQIRLIAEVSSSGEIFEVDDVSLVGTRSVRSGAGIATLTLESGAIVTIKSDGSFSYNANGKFAYLAEDEATSDSFSYTVQDASGNTDTATITINLVGTNEGVVIVSADTVAGVTELADGDGAVLSDTGTIVFSDVDLIDVHTVTVTQETAYDSLLGDVAARGALTAVVSDPATGDGTGAVTWTFQVDNSAIEDLGENRTITQAYSVTIDDQQGSTVTRTIVVTITGVGVGSLVFGDDDTAIDTGDGDNSVTTGSGDDAVTVGDGDNTVDAGDGTNTIAAGDGSNTITTGTGNDAVMAGDGGNTVDAGEGDNSVTTGSGDDSVTVGDGANTIDAGDGTNTVQAGDGNNDVTTGSGDDSVTVGDGTNSVDAGDGTNTVAAGGGSNTITTGTGNDTVTAGDGGNMVDAGEGDNLVTTGSGDDSVTVGDGANTVDAGDGANTVAAGDGNNDVTTGSGDDSVTVGDGDNTVDAGDGTNTVAAGGGSNTITTGTGDDTVTAGDGGNTVDAGGGDNAVTTGSGDDSVTVGDGTNTVDAGDGTNTVQAGDGNNDVTTGSGDDSVTVGDGDNTVDAGDGTNTVAAGGGSNTITTGTGNDTVTAGDGGNTVDAGEGDNSVTTGSGDDSVTVGDGDNTVDAGDGTNTVQAGDGNNDVTTGSGDDSVTVGDGDNTVDAGDGTNTVAAGGGSNTITTGTGNDTVTAGDGGNAVDAGEGDNSVTTGSGDDSVTVGDGTNTVDAGDGANTVLAGDGNNDVTTGSGDDSVTVGDGDNTVDAGDGTNTVQAGDGNNDVTTGSGDDSVTVGDGTNTVAAGGGSNTITTGTGNDTVTAGDGGNTVDAGEGDNSVTTGSGDDSVTVGDGANTVDAGDGNNDVTTGSGDDSVTVGDGTNSVDAGDGTNTVAAGGGSNTITTGTGNDTVTAGDGGNTVDAGEGDNAVTTGSGDDSVTVGDGANTVDAGDGTNTVQAGDGTNDVTTGSGDDSVTVGDGDNTVDAGDGTNTIAAGDGSNTITTGIGNDTVTAGDGGNTVDAGEGDNSVTTGSGDDSVSVGDGDNTVDAGDGTNTVQAGDGNNSVTTGSGDDSVTVGDGDNTVDAGDGTNTVQAGDGNNDVTTGSGDDSVTVGDGDNTVDAGDGTNTVAAGGGSNTITTGTGNDTVKAGDGGNAVDAGEGNNSVTTGSGDDSVTVGDGTNTVDAGDGANTVLAGDGNNDVTTGSGDDSVTVGDGDNTLDAGDGTNTVQAGDGNNDVTTGSGDDSVTVGDGDNTVDAGDGTNTVAAGGGWNTITTGTGNDTVTAGDGGNTVDAGDGDNSVTTGSGDDTIVTGSGDDILDGGAGFDTLTGGGGTDTFVISDTAGGPDLITDFSTGTDADILDLSALFPGQTVTAGNMTDFMQMRIVGGDTIVSIDPTGSGDPANFVDVAILAGSTGEITVTFDGVTLLLTENSAVEILTADASGDVVEDAAGEFPGLETTGTIAFTDADFSDSHQAAVTAVPAVALGAFLLTPVVEAEGAPGGSIGWTYTLDNDAAQVLAEGQVITEIYTVTVSDDNDPASSVTQDITVTITGTNDIPWITSAAGANEGAVTEAGNEDNGTIVAGTPSATGTLTFSDVDAIVANTASWSIAPNATNTTALGSMSIDAATGLWTYEIHNADPAIETLAEGQVETETFTATVTDEFGASVTQVVTVTIAGTNDGPVAQEDAVVPNVLAAASVLDFDESASASYYYDYTTGNYVYTYEEFQVSPNGADYSTYIDTYSYGAGNSGSVYAYGDGTNYLGGLIERIDGADFGISSLDVSSYYNYGSQVTFVGYNDGVEVGSVTVFIDPHYETPYGGTNGHVTFGGDFASIDQLAFIPGSGDYIFLDNLSVASRVTENFAVDIDVLGNDADPDAGAELSVASVDPASALGAAISINTDGTVRYDSIGAVGVDALSEGESATDSFSYTVTDEFGATDTATVTVELTGQNDAPVIATSSATGLLDVVAVGSTSQYNGAAPDGIAVLAGLGGGVFVTTDTYSSALGYTYYSSYNGSQSGYEYNYTMALGDINNDGALDIIIGGNGYLGDNYTGSGDALSVFLNNGAGRFVAAGTLSNGSAAVDLYSGSQSESTSDVELADINGDGNIDIIVAGQGSNDEYSSGTGDGLSILLGNGDGTFQTPSTFSISPNAPSGADSEYGNNVELADLNGDGVLDVVVAGGSNYYYGGSNGGIAVLLGDGLGGLETAVNYASNIFQETGLDENNATLALGDVDNDGFVDILVGGGAGGAGAAPTSLSLLRGNGDGSFQAAVNFSSGLGYTYLGSPGSIYYGTVYDRTNDVKLADLDNDGNLDIIAVATGQNSTTSVGTGHGLSILLGNGDGTFETPDTYAIGISSYTYPNEVQVADLDGDGILDVVAAESSTGLVFFAGNGDGTFAEGRAISDPFNQGVRDFALVNLTDVVAAEVGENAAGAGATDPGTVEIGVEFADPDANDTHTYSMNTGATNGSVVNNGDGTFTYSTNNSYEWLAEGQVAIDTFKVTVTDNHSASDTATVAVTITGTNDAPVITTAVGGNAGAVTEAGNQDNGAIVAGTPSATGTLSFSDVDSIVTDNASWSIAPDATNATALGSMSIDPATGLWTYEIDNADPTVQALVEGQVETETFTATVTDEFGATATQTVTVTINGTNDAPTAVADFANGDDLSGYVQNPDNGHYYKFFAGGLSWQDASAAAAAEGGYLATITAPAESAFALSLDSKPLFAWLGGNDTANEGQWLWVEGPEAGTPIVYQPWDAGEPNDGFTGEDFLIMYVDSGNLGNWNDLSSNPNPNVGFLVEIDTRPLARGSVATNDSDVDLGAGATLSYALVAPVAGLTLGADGAYAFDPADAAYGYLAEGEVLEVVAGYAVTDEFGATAQSTLTITLTGTNQAPVAVIDTNATDALVEQGFGIAGDDIAAGNLLANDTDIDALDVLAVTNVDSGTGETGSNMTVDPSFTQLVTGRYGLLAISADGSWEYTLNNLDADTEALADGDTGIETFTYTISDGNGGTDTSTLTLEIAGSGDNVAPVANDDDLTVTEDTPATLDLLANDTDGNNAPVVTQTLSVVSINGQAATVGAVIATDHGSITIGAGGAVNYTPDADFSGADSFTYIASDGLEESAEATVTLDVAAVNDAPEITLPSAGSISFTGGSPVGDSVSVPGLTLGSAYTLEAWVRNDAPSLSIHSTTIMEFSNDNPYLGLTPAGHLYLWNSGASSSTPLPRGEWVHVAASVDAGVSKLYVNGAHVATGTAPSSSGTGLGIGHINNDTGWVGLIDEVRVWTVARTEAEIVAAKDIQLTGNEAGLEGYWTFNEGSGGTTADLTGNGHTGALTNAAAFDADGFAGSVANFATVEDNTVLITGVTISDVDAGAGDVLAILSVVHGSVAFGDLTGITVTAGANDSATVTVQGTVAAINTTLAALNYSPDADYNGNDILSLQVSDLGNTGSGGAMVDTVEIPIMIMPVNDGPVAVADALAATEDTAVTYTAAQLLGNDTDVDNQAGDLAIASVTSGTGGTAALNLDGTVTFTPDADFNGAADFTYTISDGDLESASATATVNVAVVNDAPVIAGGTSAGAILVNDTGALDSAVTWGQGQTHYANQTFYAGDVITFDITGVVQSGVTFQLYDSNNQILDASFRVAPGEHQIYSYTVTEELSGIRYRADAAGVGGNPGWVIDASVVSGGLDVDEDTSGSFTGLVISDVDAGSDPIAVTLEVGNGDLAFTGGTSGLTFTDSDGSDGTLAFTGSQADINAALGSLDYTGEQDFAGQDILTITADDQGNTGSGGALSASTEVVIDVAAVNDAPEILGAASVGATTVNDIQAYNVPNSPGNGGFNSSYSGLPGNQSDGRSISGFAAGDQVTFTVSGANYFFVLRDASGTALAPFDGLYSNQVPGGSFTSTYTVTGGADTTLSWYLGANNQTGGNPSYTVTASAVPVGLEVDEDGSAIFSGVSIADIDADGGIMDVTMSVGNGTLDLLSSTGLTVTDADGSDGMLAFSGSLSDINAALAALQYTGNADFNGTDALSITVSDNGNTGSGGPLSVTKSVAINVAAVNDAPVAVADELSGTEDTVITFTAAELLGNDTDVDNPAGDLSIASVTSGTGGTAVLNLDGTVTFTPDADFNGAADFTYTTSDGDLESAPATATVNVAAVNDAPEILGAASVGATTVNDIQAYNVPNSAGNGGFNSSYSGLPGNQSDGRSISGFAAGDQVTFTVSGANYFFVLRDGAGTALAPFDGLYSNQVPGGSFTSTYTVTGGADTTLSWYLGANNQTGGNPSYTVTASAVPAGLDVDEDGSAVFSGLSIADIDVGSGDLVVTLSVGNGTLDLLSSTGLTVNDADGSDGTLAFSGSLSDINAALAALQYTGNADFNGTDALSITVSDNGNTGSGGALSVTKSVAINVAPVNDAPVAVADELSGTEDTVITFTAAELLGNDTDVDNPAGDLSIASVTSGTGGTAVLNLDGTVTFTPDADFNGVADFTYTTSDGNLESAPATATVNVAAVNDVAIVTAGGTLGYTENDAATVIDGGITLSDVDDSELEGATVAISSGFQSSQDILGFTDQNGITGSYSAATGILTLTGTAIVAQYQAALASVTYANSSEAADTTDREISFTVNDGDADSAVATSTVTVAAVNDAPSILGGTSAGAILVNDTGALDSAVTWGQGQTHYANQTFYAGDVITFDITGVVQSGVTFQLYDSNNQALDASFRVAPGEHQVYSYTVTEELSGIRYRADAAGVGGNPGWVIDASVVSGGLQVDEDTSGSFTGLSVSDVDAGSDPIAVTLEVGNGDLAFTGGTSGLTFTDSDGSDGTLAFTGSQADINAALGSLDYTGEQDFAGQDILTITADDQGNTGSGGALSASTEVVIDVAAVNDAPEILGAASVGATTVNDIQAYNVPNSPGNGGFNSSYSGLPGNQSDGRSISGFAAGDQVTFTVSGANYFFVLRDGAGTALAPFDGLYSNQVPGGSFTSTYTVTGGADTTLSWYLGANNQTGGNPSYTVTASAVPAGLEVDEDGSAVFSGVSIADIDADGGIMDVTMSVGNGTLDLLSSTGLTVTDADGSDGMLAFSGSLSDINAALAALQYTGNADFNGTDALSITVSDNGNTGSGGPLSVTKSVAINVAAVNDAPVAVADELSGTEDTVITFTAAELLGNDRDVDNPAGDLSIASVTSGTGGTAVLNLDGTVTFTPDADFNGAADFTYTTSDGDLVSASATATVNVAPVNDAPVIPTEALLYQVENPSFSGGVPSYTTNAAADLTGAIERVQYRMEVEGINGTLYYAEVSFDAWPGLTAADLAVPTTANGIVIQRDVTNLTVESNYPGVVNGSGFEGRLEIWPYDYSRNAAPGFAGDGATYDVSDTHTGNSSYGSFQIHNLSAPAPQTVFAWNNHNGTPDIGFGNNPGADPDWTFAGSPNLDESTWSLQISVAVGLESAETAENDAGALLASFDVSDIDTATGLTFKVLNASDEVDTRFEVVAASGTTNGEPGTYELRLNSGESLDHETDPTIGLKVEVNDHGLVNNLTTLPVTVTVSDVNDAPVAVDDTFAPLAETLVTFDPGSWQNIPDGYGGLNWSSDTSPNGSTPDFYFGQYGGRTSGYSGNVGANSTFESPDGSEFDLNSLNLRKFGLEQTLEYQTNYAATEVEVSGYRDGVEVYSGVAVSLNFTGTDVALNFENIDAFKISVTGFGAVAGHGLFELDNISYSKGLSISEDAAHTFTAADLVGNDTDADGDTLSVSAVSATSVNGAAITLKGDGTVSYDPTASVALQALGEGDSTTDTFIYTVSDGNGGMDTGTATMTVTGTNDAAILSGDVTGAVTEDAVSTTVSGNLDSSDIDNADDAFQEVAAGAATANQYGTYAVNAAGLWTYTLDNANPAVDALTNGHTLTDSFTVLSEDGTAQTVDITINGNTGAAALVSGPPLVVAYIDYDGVAGYDPAADTLIARVIDTNQDGFTGAGDELQFGFYPLNYSASAVGTFSGANQTITSAYGGAGVSGLHIQTQEGGAYYLLDRGDMEQFSSPNFIFRDAIPEQGTGSNQLSLNASAGDPASPNQNASQPSVEFIGVGNQAFLEINFATANDAVITGDVSGAVIEDAALTTVSGDLNAADATNTADAFRVITAGAMTVNSYGTYAVDAAGVWTYTLDNANPAVGALNNGQTLSDSFIVYTEDGTAQTVDIVIDGANDVLVVGSGGDDILIGNDLDNVVNGGAGNDMLTGGLGDDTFVFILGDGVDTVTDFEDGLDLVDVSSFGFASVDDLIFTQDGTDAVITGLGDGQEIRLDNTLVADLGNDDFNFL